MKFISGTESFGDYICRFRLKFSENDTYIIFGAGLKAEKVRNRFPNILFLVDNNKDKQGMTVDGLEIKAPDVLKEYKAAKIIVAVHGYKSVEKQLNEYGILEENYCRYNELLMIEDYISHDKIVVPEITFMINNRCTLSCKGCIEYIPYVKEKVDFPIEQIKNSLDAFFEKIDYCEDISLVGGEALLYGKLGEILDYLYTTYISGGRLNTIKITTNATIIPSQDIMQRLKLYGVVVVMSDYKSAIGSKCKIDELIAMFSSYGIRYLIEDHFSRVGGKWFNMGNPLCSRNMTTSELTKHFGKCTVMCPAVWNSRLFNCNGVRSHIMNFTIKKIPVMTIAI